MAVDDQHDEYKAALPRWSLTDDMCDEVNLAAHVRDLSVMDGTQKNKEFKERASFFGASGITETGLLGVAFEDAPELEVPPVLEYLKDNVDGTGINFDNHVIASLSHVLRKGRLGLFVTYPQTEGDVSVADQEDGAFVATIHAIDAKRITNWWSIQRGAKAMLGGVVFTDCMEERDGFNVKKTDILRSLTLEDGVVYDRKWQKVENSAEWTLVPNSEFTPKDSTGAVWKEIPFVFCGSKDNTWAMDKAPLYSLARKNADHLNNSAINEEGIWFSGHIQPCADEMDAEAYDVLMKNKEGGFKIGSGQMIVAKGFKYEVAEPNSAARQGMVDKVEEMKGIGARILQPGGVAKTAQQDAGEQRVQHSVLSLAVTNLEDAYNTCLRWAGQYMGADGAEVRLSKSFMDPEITAEMIDRLIALYDRSLAGTEEMHNVLTRFKIVNEDKTAEDYAEEVASRGGSEDLTDFSDNASA